MKYEQATGKFYDSDGNLIGVGWSGHDAGKNNPLMENTPDIGPLPTGNYYIQDPEALGKLGAFAMPLFPFPTNEMYGRFSFLIHGASVLNPGESSHGCIIQPRPTREIIAQKIGGTPKYAPARLLTVI